MHTRIILSITISLLFHFALVAQILCPELESNNTSQTANNISLNCKVSGTTTVNDLDWFLLNITQTGILKIDISKLNTSEILVELFDGNNSTPIGLTSQNLTNTEAKDSLIFPVKSGRHYVRIQFVSGLSSYEFTPSLDPAKFSDDPEPNDDISQAISMNVADTLSGNIGYKTGAGTDVLDWYKVNLDKGGVWKLKIEKFRTHQITVFIREAQIQGPASVTILANKSLDSLSYPLLKGTYYVLVIADNHLPVDYKIISSFEIPKYGEDAELNDDISQAISVNSNGSFSGTVAYYKPSLGTDVYDWYKLNLDKGGIWKLKIDKFKSNQISVILRTSLDAGVKSVVIPAAKSLDSLSHPLLKGTYYVLVVADNHLPADYKITATLENPKYPEDPEPNNDFLTAKSKTLLDTLSGTIGYYQSVLGTDGVDLFKMKINERGILKLYIKKMRDGEFNIHMRTNPTQAFLASGFLYSNETMDSVKYKFQKPDSLFIQLTLWARISDYQIIPSFLLYPKSDFSFEQIDNKVIFTNKALRATSYNWIFGDNTTSIGFEPFKVYDNPGVYNICLESSNEAGKDTSCQMITIKGINSIYPKSGGNTGDVTLSVFGGGMDSESIVRIVKNNQVIAEQTLVRRLALDAISARLDLRNKPIGKYDIEVETKNGELLVLPNAFEILQGTFPDPWVEISGRNKILFNRPGNYTLKYGNNGNVDATMVPVYIAVSQVPGLKIEFPDDLFIALNESQDSIIQDTSTDSLDSYYVLDSVLGEPFYARVYPLIIPVIPAASNGEINLKITTSASIDFRSWTNMPFFQSPIDSVKLACMRDVFSDVIEPLIANVGDLYVSVSLAACISAQFEAGFSDFIMLYNEPFRIGLETPDSVISGLNRSFDHTPTNFMRWLTLINEITKGCLNYINSQTSPPLFSDVNKFYRETYSPRIGRALTNLFTLDPQSLGNCLKGNCPNTKSNNPGECRECATFCSINVQRSNVQAVSSFDPNEKEGPAGFSESNYHSFQKSIPFTIHFENLATATAPAHEVRVLDKLDPKVFDFKSFQFNSVSIAQKTYYPDKGNYRMFIDIPVERAGVLARVEARFDTLTGSVEWLFRSIDTLMFKDIDDPDIGFLPPNKSNAEGEGSVSFSIDLKENLKDGTVIKNDALIYFDANAPIATNVYKMTLDLSLPQSKVDILNEEYNSSSFDVSWTGSDDGSGIKHYDVFVSDNDSSFVRWKIHTQLTKATFLGKPGHKYRFYSLAVDKVGNEERSPDVPDAVTKLTTSTFEIKLEDGWKVFPNPSAQSITISGPNIENRHLIIENIQGQRMADWLLKSNENNIELSALPNGFYQVRVMDPNGIMVHRDKLVVLK